MPLSLPDRQNYCAFGGHRADAFKRVTTSPRLYTHTYIIRVSWFARVIDNHLAATLLLSPTIKSSQFFLLPYDRFENETKWRRNRSEAAKFGSIKFGIWNALIIIFRGRYIFTFTAQHAAYPRYLRLKEGGRKEKRKEFDLMESFVKLRMLLNGFFYSSSFPRLLFFWKNTLIAKTAGVARSNNSLISFHDDEVKRGSSLEWRRTTSPVESKSACVDRMKSESSFSSNENYVWIYAKREREGQRENGRRGYKSILI